ncbi:MAG: glycosyltransferase family 39 protein [Chloroflexota bacterium]|nr:glycosyltransferase family 39 protein [Chloroflexota bacterium]
MNTKIDNTPKDDAAYPPSNQAGQPKERIQRRFSSIDIAIFCVLALVALIPRIILAGQLDVVTDEVVYILGGKIYLPLLAHLKIGASGWMFNYEHPPFVKLLIGLVLVFNSALGHPLGELFAARVPSIICGTLLVVALYALGRGPVGRATALLAALCLAVSPWLVYFSALAYLDMTMTALITVAYLLLWYAIRRPWLYLVVGALIGLATASKYTASLAIPGIVLFIAYYYLALRPRLPAEQRPAWPWKWWVGAIILAPIAFLAVDPAIWPQPISLLHHSFDFEFNHSINGHLTFLAGTYSLHVPHWAILYIIFTKMSAFVTIPAAFFCVFALVQLVRFHLRKGNVQVEEATALGFLFIWLIAILSMFSLLNIVVGTHYHLPLAPPVALAGAAGLAVILRYRRGSLFAKDKIQATTDEVQREPAKGTGKIRINPRAAGVLALMALLLIGSHLFGLITVRDAEGYTNEFFPNENNALQVAYPGYRDAVQWIATQDSTPAHIGLVALPGTLNGDASAVSWFTYNQDLPKRFTLTEVHPTDKNFSADYLVWPMHLVQRGYAIPANWHAHIIHIVMGGQTVYCYILANPARS